MISPASSATTTTTHTTWVSQFFTTSVDSSDANSVDHFPLCSFYDESSLTFESNGCYLIDYSKYESTCINWEQFAPEINFLSTSEWRQVNLSSLIEYPLGWVVVSVWGLV